MRLFLFVAALFLFLSVGADDAFASANQSEPQIQENGDGQSKGQTSITTENFNSTSALIEVAPLWEDAYPSEGRSWTLHTYDVLKVYGRNLLAGAKDIGNFCPNYRNLDNDQKLNFWTYFVSALAKYESGMDPTSRYREASMGIDRVTGQHVYSEGLLQLSYQDTQVYTFCDEFDWQSDRHLDPNDPRKTILDPQKNLKCGLQILNHMVGRVGLIEFSNGNYWSTLKPNHGSVRGIQHLTANISFCRR